MARRHFLQACRVLLLALAMAACAVKPSPTGLLRSTTESLSGGPQSKPTPEIRALVEDLKPLPPRERLVAMLQRVSELFVFDPWQQDDQLRHSAGELAAARGLGGCGAYALVEVAMVRALGLPARLVLTADADWLKRYQADGLSLISGHAFIEVQETEGRWLLLDPTFFGLYDGYLPGLPFYPQRQVFVARGLDFHDLGLRTMTELQALYAQAASTAPLPWQEPKLSPIFTLPIDPPTALTKAGQFFLHQGRLLEAEDRLSKAINQAPDSSLALQSRGHLFFLRQDYNKALTDLDRALQVAPTDPTSYLWRAQTLGALGRHDQMCTDLDQACTFGECEDQKWARRQGLCLTVK